MYELSENKYLINDLNDTLMAERKMMREIILKDNVKLEKKIDKLIKYKKCKKSYSDFKGNNVGLNYIMKEMSYNDVKANKLAKQRQYNRLKEQQAKLNNNRINFKADNFTRTALLKYQLENKSLEQQIKALENQNQNRFNNKLDRANNLKVLRGNKDLQYVFPKYNKSNHEPITNKMMTINNKLKYLNNKYGISEKKYGTGLNKDLLSKIKKLKYDISNNPKYGKLEVANMKRVLQSQNQDKELKNKLKDLENKMLQNQTNNTNNKIPVENLNKELLLKIKQLKDDIADNNKQYSKLEVSNMKKVFQDLKKDKELKKKLKDLEKQLVKNQTNNSPDENLNKELLLKIKKLKDEIANNIKPDKLKVLSIEKALENLEKEKDKKTKVYTPETKTVLKKLNVNNKPIQTQISKLQNKLKKDKELKNKLKDLEKQIAENKTNNSPVENLEKQMADKQINSIDNKQDNSNKVIKDKIKKLQNALAVLEKIKQLEDDSKYSNSTKPIINKDIEDTIQYLEDKEINSKLKPTGLVQYTMDKFNIKDSNVTDEQLSELYKNLYFVPRKSADVSKLNYVINKLKKAKEIEDKLTNINKLLEKNKPIVVKPKKKKSIFDDNELVTTIIDNKNKVRELNKKLEKKEDILIDNKNKVKELNKKLEKKEEILIDNKNKVEELNKKLVKKEDILIDNKNKVEELNKKLVKNKGTIKHLKRIKNIVPSCWITDSGVKSVDLFTLYLRDNNINVEVGSSGDSKKLLERLGSSIPNLDSLLHKTMSLNKFMKLTRSIYEKSVKEDCRYTVYFIDKTISKRAYKRKTLIIQNHFYKRINGAL
jgi:hypothetical protein